ncbi:MAG: metallophosphoesterase family protein [Verrucomicrobium sp.]|nr:metallophosphoesterase family protein [Verrucomicrobium sp.]
MFFLVILGLFLLGDGICWFSLHRILQQAGAPLGWRIALDLFMFFQIAGLSGLVLSRFWEPALALQSLWGKTGLSLILLWHFLVMLPLGVGLAISACLPSPAAAFSPGPGFAGLNRRQFLALLGTGAAPLATFALTGISLYQLRRFSIRRLTVDVPGLPAELEGMTIAHLSDIHVGQLTHGPVLDDMVHAFNELDADLGAVTGDLINYDLDDLPRALEVIQGLRAKQGVFVCEGNHDLLENAAEFERRAREIEGPGHRFLLNESATTQVGGHPVQVLGVRWTGQYDGGIQMQMHALPPLEPGAFPLLLAHHPHAFETAEAMGIPLVLAGHTHGGQLMLTDELGCGPMFFRYWSGLYRRAKGSLVVSNGTGNWFPLRVHAPAEILHLTLRRAA